MPGGCLDLPHQTVSTWLVVQPVPSGNSASDPLKQRDTATSVLLRLGDAFRSLYAWVPGASEAGDTARPARSQSRERGTPAGSAARAH